MNYKIRFEQKKISAKINLPFSKSISNRLLIIQALTKGSFKINNLSESDDTQYMSAAFGSDKDIVNIGHAGTAMRFLTAYFAAAAVKKTITGSERMKNRPIEELVNALNFLGADIRYAEKKGFPPLVTSGKTLTGNNISAKGSISSQYITALLLIAPTLPQGLTIRITDKLISSSYVKLTLEMMRFFGIESQWKDNEIKIEPQEYRGREYTVEADWSGASYWYQIALLADFTHLTLKGLFKNSSQGDSAIARLFNRLGIETIYTEEGIKLQKHKNDCEFFEFDFVDNPDMVQTFVVALCLKGIPFKLRGAQSLRIKETDRIAAMQNEMQKLGFSIQESASGILEWNGVRNAPLENIRIDTYDDHRMALAFAPAAFEFPGLIINNAEVVTKSYPNYWSDLQLIGANLELAG